VLAGDTTSMNLDHSLGMFFQPDDADKDDYTQDCVGGDESAARRWNGALTVKARTSCSMTAM